MRLLMIITVCLFFTACEKPACHNENPVFNANNPGSAVYHAALKKLIQQQPKAYLHYYIEGYQEKNGREYMLVEIQTKNTCAHLNMEITGSKRLGNSER